MKRILQLAKQYPPFKGGVELVSQMISRAHCDHGDKVNIVSFGNGQKKYDGEYGESVFQVNRDVFFKSAPISFSLFFKFKKKIKENRIDTIYVHLPNPYMHQLVVSYRSFLRKNKVKVIAVYHSDLVNQKHIAPIYDYYFISTSKIYDEVIVSSHKLWQSSSVLNRLPINKQRVIPFCVNTEVEYRKRANFSGKLLSIGRFVPYKGFDFLVDALGETNYQLTIIGDGPMRSQVESQASSNISIKGLVSDQEKKDILANTDVLVLPSINRAEAYGMVIVEAFKAGIPVVASNINSGVTYLVEDGIRGKTFEIENKEQLLSAIKSFEDDRELLSRCSENARHFYEKNLDYTVFKDKLLER